ncbi:MAG: tRNA dihydrouridine synthase DusB [Gammaproteobacteria bacterium]
MAGVTDRPFRQLCKRLGAGMAVSEMITSDTRLWNSAKTRCRLDHDGEAEPRVVQIAGADPAMMAEAARLNIERGAQIIDINMGCPAKKVCNAMAGSALLQDEPLVARILQSVVRAVEAPVTLKIRTGSDPAHRNGARIAHIAEDAGVSALTVHGRTRACGFKGEAEYETIRRIKRSVTIPVIANGDVDTPESAKKVLASTGADAIMIGRAAQGRPWLFGEINHYLCTGSRLQEPSANEVQAIMLDHLHNLYAFYGEQRGVRIARKHIGWYLKHHGVGKQLRDRLMRVDSAAAQTSLVCAWFECHEWRSAA